MLRYTFEVEEGARLWSEANFPSEQVLIAERKLQSLLKPALESLYCLTAICWRWHHWRDSQWSLDTILECLEGPKLCRNIKEFTFAYHPSFIDIGKPFPLPNLKQLRVFSVSGALFESDFEKIAHHPIMSNNLKTLHLSQDRIRYSSIPFDNHIPATVSDLRLHGLRLESVGKVTYRNITSLDLGTLMSTNREWDALWDILSSRRIHLRDFAIHHITRANHDMDKMLNYFQSYSGLESFSLKGPVWYDPSSYDSYAIQFYENVLPMHVETLTKLELKPEFESKWCFGVDNINIVRRCKRLRSLWVKVDHRGLEPDVVPERSLVGTLYGDGNSPMSLGSSSAGASYPNLVHLLLQLVSSDLPDLERLTLEPARNPSWAHDHTDMISGAQFRLGIQRRLRASVESFARDLSNNVLQWVRIYIVNERVIIAPIQDQADADGKQKEGKIRKKKVQSETKHKTASVFQQISGFAKRLL
ncbi:hypothetical protein F5051DRAFT_141986 [Lentinula edodes]|nr:hypothetical protein F5051DRAFT_141986 [Lentinula edodes]